MLGPEKIKQLTDLALSFSKAEQTEVLVRTVDSALSRFANNTIHQNVFDSDATVRVRLIFGKRTGIAELNDLSPEGIRRAVETARAVAQLQPDNPNNPPLPAPLLISTADAFVERTAECSPEMRARTISNICRQAAAQNLLAAGAFRTDAYEIAVANSLGVMAYQAGTVADLHMVMMFETGSGSGYASAASPDVRAIDAESLARSAMDKALRSRDAIALAPGEYTVVLEPYAVANVLQYLAFNTFNALAVQEERSFVRGRRGELLFSPQITMYDDGLDPSTFALPFDHEGVPRQKVIMIEQGVARDVVYDTVTARRDRVASTGHSLPAPNTDGPLPRHLCIAPGTASSDELIGSVTRGVLITRFWYTRVVHPVKATMTGLTRDGTFLIEHGKVTLPVKNLRFTTSYVDALANTALVGRDAKLIHDDRTGMSFRVPSLVVERLNFTGVTQ